MILAGNYFPTNYFACQRISTPLPPLQKVSEMASQKGTWFVPMGFQYIGGLSPIRGPLIAFLGGSWGGGYLQEYYRGFVGGLKIGYL
jgi:hypothetical protein